MAFTFRIDPNASAASVNNGFADSKAETCTLYEVVKLYKTLKNGRLLLLGDTGTSILTEEVQSLLALTIHVA